MESSKLRGAYIDPNAGRVTFRDYALEWADAQQWKAGSRETWPSIFRRLDSRIGKRHLAEIDRLTLQKLQRDLGEQYARSTVVLTVSFAKAIMRDAFANQRIAHDPTVGIKPPRASDDGEDDRVGPDNVPTRAEALSILQGAPSRYRAAIAMGLAGCRIGEVLGLRAESVDSKVRIDVQLQRLGGELVLTTPKTKRSTRTITVPALVAVELRRHLRDHVGDGFLFRAPRTGEPMRRDQAYASAWRPALRAAGLDEDRYKFHSLRHWCASTLLAEGAPITAVAAHLGDVPETVMRTYAHWLRDEDDVPASVLDRVLAPAAEGERVAGDA